MAEGAGFVSPVPRRTAALRPAGEAGGRAGNAVANGASLDRSGVGDEPLEDRPVGRIGAVNPFGGIATDRLGVEAGGRSPGIGLPALESRGEILVGRFGMELDSHMEPGYDHVARRAEDLVGDGGKQLDSALRDRRRLAINRGVRRTAVASPSR